HGCTASKLLGLLADISPVPAGRIPVEKIRGHVRLRSLRQGQSLGHGRRAATPMGSRFRTLLQHAYTGAMRFPALPCILLLAVTVAGCSKGVDWSAQERENAAHIQASLAATSDAAAIANDMSPGDTGSREALLRELRAAHLHAARVEDSTLDKLHQQ